MVTVADRKVHPISMRLPESDVAMIDRAAEEVVMESGLIRMSAEGFAAFMDVVSADTAPVPEMVDLARQAAPWESRSASKP